MLSSLTVPVLSVLVMLDGVVAQGRQGLVFRRARVDKACVERVQAAVRQRVFWVGAASASLHQMLRAAGAVSG